MNLKKVRLRSARNFEPKPTWHFPTQRHTFHELLVINSGKMKVDIEGQEVTGTGGDVLFYQAGRLHTETNNTRRPVRFIYIPFEADIKGQLRPKTRDDQGRLRQLAHWLVQEWGRHGPGSGPVREHLFQTLLAEWIRLQIHHEHPLVETVRAFVQLHIERTISLDELADHCGMSKFHFTRTFKNIATRTPMEEVRTQRIERAQNLILTTEIPLKAIAPKCGLGDQFHMTRLFRRYLNATPGEMRSARKG